MSSASKPKWPGGLLAVLLITRSRPGPKLVFHYPTQTQSAVGGKGDPESHDSDSEFESDDESEVQGSSHEGPNDTAGSAAGLKKVSLSSDLGGDILGYSSDSLEKLLSPGRWSDRKKFEVCLDGVTFVGYPVYAYDNNSWSTKEYVEPTRRDIEDERTATPTTQHRERPPKDADVATTGTASITITGPDTPDQATYDFTHIPESLDSQRGLSLATSMNSTSTASGAAADQMAMFHVVFAMRPHLQHEVSDVYEHVIRKLSKALHYCQKQTNYVTVESKRLLALSAKAKLTKTSENVLLTQMVESSELAWALKEVYEHISTSEIAGIRLDGMELSLRIPHGKIATDPTDDTLGPHSGLLLLEEKEILLRELSHPEASPLNYFIREHTPTKSLQKHSTSLNMPLSDILYLARHLMEWRKAKSIAPLHSRNMYTTHPQAPNNKLSELLPVYGRKFAALPSLPQMLKMLSGKPIQYGLLIPSRDHRTPYMEILAFLIRHQFVVQLKTYGWLRADPHIETRRAEDGPKGRAKRPVSGISLLSPHLRPVDDDNASVSSGRTTIPLSDVPADEKSPGAEPRPILVLDPSNATEDESMVLQHIKEQIPDVELRQRFPQFFPYLDGEHAFEDIAAEEGMKRANVEECLGLLQQQDHLRTFRSI